MGSYGEIHMMTFGQINHIPENTDISYLQLIGNLQPELKRIYFFSLRIRFQRVGYRIFCPGAEGEPGRPCKTMLRRHEIFNSVMTVFASVYPADKRK